MTHSANKRRCPISWPMLLAMLLLLLLFELLLPTSYLWLIFQCQFHAIQSSWTFGLYHNSFQFIVQFLSRFHSFYKVTFSRNIEQSIWFPPTAFFVKEVIRWFDLSFLEHIKRMDLSYQRNISEWNFEWYLQEFRSFHNVIVLKSQSHWLNKSDCPLGLPQHFSYYFYDGNPFLGLVKRFQRKFSSLYFDRGT